MGLRALPLRIVGFGEDGADLCVHVWVCVCIHSHIVCSKTLFLPLEFHVLLFSLVVFKDFKSLY